MIEGIEISPSDRARCYKCGKNIRIGTPRGVESEPYKNHLEYSYYCYKCSLIQIKDLLKRLNALIKEKKKEIILMELEDNVEGGK